MNNQHCMGLNFLSFLITVLCLTLFSGLQTVYADLPNAPLVIDTGNSGCVPATEICGDGIDQDCDGSDLRCDNGTSSSSTIDADNDGYPESQDCDDNNHHVFPSISVTCSAGCGQGTKTCKTDGTFTSCSCTPLCEAVAGGHCYYISKLTGSDANPGTFDRPWKTTKLISSYYCRYGTPPANCNGDVAPQNTVSLRPGDVVYMMSGVYNESIRFGQTGAGLFIYAPAGTAAAPITIKAYPGAHPVLAPTAKTAAIRMYNASYLVFEGLEITKAYGEGIHLADSIRNIEMKNNWIHDVDGVDNDNIAGLKIGDGFNIRVHHSTFNDNYDRTCADTGGLRTENSRDIVLFGGGNVRFDHNSIFQTPPITADKTGVCLGFKHHSTEEGAIFEVDHNVFLNCWDAAVQSYTPRGRFHHNLIVNSEKAWRIWGATAFTNLVDYVIEKNTIVNTQGLDYRPSSAIETGGIVGPIRYQNNIVVFSGPYRTDVGGIYNIDTWGSNTIYNQVTQPGQMVFGNNCFYNPSGSVLFGLFSANDIASRDKGGLFTLAQWQALGYDTSSVVLNPQLDSSFRPQAASCSGAGRFAP